MDTTPEEEAEMLRLEALQMNHKRWFSQEEFDRLKYLQRKYFDTYDTPRPTYFDESEEVKQ